MVVHVVVPTVSGREEYLKRCLQGYERSCPEDVELNFLTIRDAPTCGVAWQSGADQVERGDGEEFLHLTADDIVPGEGWLEPMVEAVRAGAVPVGLVVTPTAEILDPVTAMPLQGNPVPENPRPRFFEREGDETEVADWYEAQEPSEYPSVPFCSLDQWLSIGPMIVPQYGGDRWFGERARRAGIRSVVRHGCCFYHYAAQPGRIPRAEGWFHLDRITFDLNIAYPMYESGALAPEQFHPESETASGRELARTWYREHVPGPYYWEQALCAS